MQDPKHLSNKFIEALEDIKAIDILKIDVSHRTPFFDTLLICSGRSTRHMKAIAKRMLEAAHAFGLPNPKLQGDQESEWILVDTGDNIIHIMTPTSRVFYNLEGLWDADKDELAAN
jgi:ribosome-associated protein